jgi:hypothetical protein
MDANFMLAARPSQRTESDMRNAPFQAFREWPHVTTPFDRFNRSAGILPAFLTFTLLIDAAITFNRHALTNYLRRALSRCGRSVLIVIPTTTQLGSEEESAFPARCCAPASRPS